MKIFLSFLQSHKNHPIPAYGFWEYYIKNGIDESGHQWVECREIDWAKGLVPQGKNELENWRSESWEKTIKFLKENPVDLFLSYLYPKQVDADAIKKIQKMGIPCINFFCDNVREFKSIPIEFATFDLNWVPEYKALSMYRNAGIKYIHLPMPMWVDPKYRTPSKIVQGNISFIGSKDIQRQLFFEELIKLNPTINLAIYGNGWRPEVNSESQITQSNVKRSINQIQFISKHGIKSYLNKLKFGSYNPPISNALEAIINGKISFEEYIRITRESNITIGVNRYPSFNFPLLQSNSYSRLRDIEAPMLGACYLTEWTEGLDEMYEIEKEIETFKNQDQFVEKVKELEIDSIKRMSLRRNGQKKALQALSIPNSINKIIKHFKNID